MVIIHPAETTIVQLFIDGRQKKRARDSKKKKKKKGREREVEHGSSSLPFP